MIWERTRQVYSGIKAPKDLKEAVRRSIKAQRVRKIRQSVAGLSAAACLMVVFLGGFLDGKAPLIRLEGDVITEQAMELSAYAEHTAAPLAGMARSMPVMETRLQIPLEIKASGGAHVSVSAGRLQDRIPTDSDANFVTELYISGENVVYWMLEETAGQLPVCTVTAEEGICTYVIEFDQANAVYTIRQKTDKE